jgi:hypothetical protein
MRDETNIKEGNQVVKLWQNFLNLLDNNLRLIARALFIPLMKFEDTRSNEMNINDETRKKS